MEIKKVFAVIGLGAFGTEVCRVLTRKGGKVIAADNDPKLVERIQDEVAEAVLIDSTDEDSLRNAGLADVDIAIVAIGTNIESSILTAALLKNIGVPYVVARAVSDIHGHVLHQIGCTEVIHLEIEEGRRVASRLIAPDILDIIPISESYSIAELRMPASFAFRSIAELDLRKSLNLNIICIKRVSQEISASGQPVMKETTVPAGPEEICSENDILYVAGRPSDIERLKNLS